MAYNGVRARGDELMAVLDCEVPSKELAESMVTDEPDASANDRKPAPGEPEGIHCYGGRVWDTADMMHQCSREVVRIARDENKRRFDGRIEIREKLQRKVKSCMLGRRIGNTRD